MGDIQTRQSSALVTTNQENGGKIVKDEQNLAKQ